MKEVVFSDIKVEEAIKLIVSSKGREKITPAYAHLECMLGMLERGDISLNYVTKALNSLQPETRILEQALQGKLIERLDFTITGETSPVRLLEAKASLAGSMIRALEQLGLLTRNEEFIKELNSITNEYMYYTYIYYAFGKVPTKEVQGLPIGLHLEPGVVLQKRIRPKPGGKALKLNSKEKGLLKDLASQGLRLVKTSREELLEFFFASKRYVLAVEGAKTKGYRGEDPIVLKAQIHKSVNEILELQTLNVIYLSQWYDYRTRLYYYLTLWGINPHGTGFETHQWELAEGETILPEAIGVYYYSAASLVDGIRYTHEEAITKFLANPEYYLISLEDPTRDISERGYFRGLAKAIRGYETGEISHFIIFEDCTNSGGQNAAIDFHSLPMAEWTNLGGLTTVMDIHSRIQNIAGLETRKEAKEKISQGLFHGAAIETISENLGMSVPEADKILTAALGKEYRNIAAIASYGSLLVNTNRPSVGWITKDGHRSQHCAYIQSVPIKSFGFDKKGYFNVNVIKDIPFVTDAKGHSIYGPVKVVNEEGVVSYDNSLGGEVKIRGLYANGVHPVEATNLREGFLRPMVALGKGSINKHDNYGCHGNYIIPVARAGIKREMADNFSYRPLQKMMLQLKAAAPEVPQPVLLEGELTLQHIESSKYFLSV